MAIRVSEQIDSQNNAENNKNVWGGILYNVKVYKAKGDGVTDDTAKIQATINAANAAGGGVVFLPPGTYIVSSGGVEMKSNVFFVGAGKHLTTIKGVDFVVGSYNALTNVCVSNMTVESGASSVDAFCVYFFKNTQPSVDPTSPGGNKVVIRDCVLKNACSSAIMVVAHQNVEIMNNDVINAGENAIEVQSFVDGRPVENVRIVNNSISGWGRERVGHALSFFGRIDNLSVSGNTVDSAGAANPLRGVSFDHHNFHPDGNVTIGALGVCAGNTIDGANIGIQDQVSRMLITGNRISNATTSGLLIGTGQYIDNYIEVATRDKAFSTTLQVIKPEQAVNNHVNGPRKPSFGLVKNGGFTLWSAGDLAAPDNWSLEGTGSVARIASPPFGDSGASLTSTSGTVHLRQFFDIDTVREHILFATGWAKTATANSARLCIRTSAGDFYSDFAPATDKWTQLMLAVYVTSGDAQASVRASVESGTTASFAGMMTGMDSL